MNSFFCEIEIVVGMKIGALVTGIVQKHQNTVRPLRYTNHTCLVTINNAVFTAFHYLTCCPFFNRTTNLEQNLTGV